MRPVFNHPPEETILPVSDAGVPAASTSTGGSSTPAAAPTYAGLSVHCDFCQSRITRAAGEVLELGKRARAMRDTEIALENANKKIEQLEARIVELTPKPATPQDGGFKVRW